MKLARTLIPTLALCLAASAQAEVATGNCDGWTMTSTAEPGAGSWYTTGTATLYRWDGLGWAVWDVVGDDGLMASTFTNWSMPFVSSLVLGSSWTDTLPAGDYRVVVVTRAWASFINGSWETIVEVDADLGAPFAYRGFTREVYFSCDGPPPPTVDARTPGYWKNHASAWPVASLALGDEQTLFSRECLISFMDLSTRGDIRVILIQHLISSKLNILNGSDPMALTGFPTATSTILDTIIAADDYLRSDDIACTALIGTKPQGGEKDYVDGLKSALDAYNNNFE
jgi:hypothetical protein